MSVYIYSLSGQQVRQTGKSDELGGCEGDL